MGDESVDLTRLEAAHPSLAVDWHPELPSTNDRALQWAIEPEARLPLLVLAEQQTAGRGRRTNRWWTSSGALTFSLLLDAGLARLTPAHWPLVSLATALAVADALEHFADRSSLALKWPNDVYLDQRKVSGILIEHPAQAAGRLVIGVGINVNNALTAAPADVQQRAVSLRDHLRREMDRTEVLIRVLDQVLEQWHLLAAGRLNLKQRWGQRCLLTSRTVRVDTGKERILGRCLGIDEHGALLLQTTAGLRRCVAGVVAEYD